MAKNEFDTNYNSIFIKFGKEFDDNQISNLNDVINDKHWDYFENKTFSVNVTRDQNIYNILSSFSKISFLTCFEDNFQDPNQAQI